MTGDATDRTPERATVRAGVICIGLAAVVALIFCALPGYDVDENDGYECFRTVPNSRHEESERCTRIEDPSPTRRAGDAVDVIAAALTILLAFPVYRRGSARAVAGSALLVWIVIAIVATASSHLERVSPYLAPRWTIGVLRSASVVVFVGPFVVALAGVYVRWVDKRRRRHEPIPRAIVTKLDDDG